MDQFTPPIPRHAANAVIASVIAVLVAVPVSAQSVATSFEELRFTVNIGDTVYITQEPGSSEQKARVLSEPRASSLAVSIDGIRRELRETSVVRIRRRLPDSRINGALVGFLVGAASTTAAAMKLASPVGSCRGKCAAVNVAYGGGIGALVGLGIDSLVQGRQDIFVRHLAQSSRPSASMTRSLVPTTSGSGLGGSQMNFSWVTRHPVIFGAIVGAGVGAVAGATLGHDCGQEESFCSREGMAGIGAGAGAAVGALSGLVVGVAK
jgi:hypothetical protein